MSENGACTPLFAISSSWIPEETQAVPQITFWGGHWPPECDGIPPQKLENWKIQKYIGYSDIAAFLLNHEPFFAFFFAAFLRSHSPPPSPSFRGFVAAKQCLQQRCHASGRTSHPDLTSGAHGIGFTELPRCSQQLDMANLSFGECGIGITTITICKKNRRARRPKGSLRPGANLCLNKLWNLAGSMIFLFATTQLKFKVVQSPGLIIHTKSAWLFTILWHVGPNMRRRTGEWWQSGTVWICIYIYIYKHILYIQVYMYYRHQLGIVSLHRMAWKVLLSVASPHIYRRKFRSQTSDNMERWKAGQRQREEED